MDATENSPAMATVDPDATAAAPERPPTPPVPRIQLGKFSVPLPWVLSWARRDCANCHGRGTVKLIGRQLDGVALEVLPDGKGQLILCGCAQRVAEARLAAYVRAGTKAVDPPPAADDDQARAKAERRREGLQREVEKLEGELARRRNALQDRIASDEAEAERWRVAEENAEGEIAAVGSEVDELQERIREAEWVLSGMRETLQASERRLAEAKSRRNLAPGFRRDAEAQVTRARERFERDTQGLQKEIAKARRRLAAAIREAGGETAAPGTEAA